jgi:hypothetical protein
MTQAAEDFAKSIHDAEILLEIFDYTSKQDSKFSPDKSDVLKRAGLILAMASWETYSKNCLRELVTMRAGEISKILQSGGNEYPL